MPDSGTTPYGEHEQMAGELLFRIRFLAAKPTKPLPNARV